jgi:hypothetical protein
MVSKNELNELRRRGIYTKYERGYRTLRLWGFEIDFGTVQNEEEVRSKHYTKKEVLKILGRGGIFKLPFFLRRRFHINYWKTYRLEKLTQDVYAWDYFDRVGPF